jgi:hypothetical protein
MGWKLFLVVNSSQTQGLHPIDWYTGEALGVIIVKDFGLVVIVVVPSPTGAQTSAASILSVEQTLVRVNIGKIIGASVDRSSRVGDKVVSEVGKSTFHC